MKSQLFDIRREYKKGRLTPGNLNDNPFEQFDHWLNDAIHSDEYEPTRRTPISYAVFCLKKKKKIKKYFKYISDCAITHSRPTRKLTPSKSATREIIRLF